MFSVNLPTCYWPLSVYSRVLKTNDLALTSMRWLRINTCTHKPSQKILKTLEQDALKISKAQPERRRTSGAGQTTAASNPNLLQENFKVQKTKTIKDSGVERSLSLVSGVRHWICTSTQLLTFNRLHRAVDPGCGPAVDQGPTERESSCR